MKRFIKSSNTWKGFIPNTKQSQTFKQTGVSVKPETGSWNTISTYNNKNTITFRMVNTGTGNVSLSFTVSGDYAAPTKLINHTKGITANISSSATAITIPPGVNIIELELPAGKSLRFGANSVIQSIEDISNFKGVAYPYIYSSALVYVPNYLPPSVTNLYHAFRNCSSFNADISNWDTSRVTNFSYTFRGCTIFNQDISRWDTGKATTLAYMFRDAINFNQPIGSWNVRNVASFNYMFYGATMFNQYLKGWVIKSGATSTNFKIGSGLTAANSPF